MKAYNVTTAKDESGHWIAEVDEVPGCHTYARSLWGVHKRIREALSLWIEEEIDPSSINYSVDVPAKVQRAIGRGRRARETEQRVNEETRKALSEAVKVLEDAGFSRRDIADLLGLSHQRIQQIAKA